MFCSRISISIRVSSCSLLSISISVSRCTQPWNTIVPLFMDHPSMFSNRRLAGFATLCHPALATARSPACP